MANITFAWMLDQIRPYLAVNRKTIIDVYRQRQALVRRLNQEFHRYKVKVAEEQAAHAKESWGESIGRLASSTASYVTNPFGHKRLDLRRRDFDWGTGTMIDSYTALFYANGSLARTPGAYGAAKKHPAPGETNEQVHPTVGYRLMKTKNEREAKLKYSTLR